MILTGVLCAQAPASAAQDPFMCALAVQSPFKPMVKVYNGVRVVMEFNMRDRGKPGKYEELDKRQEAFRDKVYNSPICERFFGYDPLPSKMLLEIEGNSYDSFIDKIEEMKIPPEEFTGVITTEVFYDGDDIVINVIDNGKPVELESDGTPVKRWRSRTSEHFSKGDGIVGRLGIKEIKRNLRSKHTEGSISWHPLPGGTRTEIRIPRKNRTPDFISENEYILKEDPELLRRLTRGFKKDAKIKILQHLRKQARELGMGEAEITKLVEDILTGYEFREPVDADQEGLMRIAVSLASFGHETNQITKITDRLMALQLYSISIKDIINRNENFIAYYREIDDFLHRMNKYVLETSKFQNVHSNIWKNKEIKENAIMLGKMKLKEKYNKLKKLKRDFELLKKIITAQQLSEDDADSVKDMTEGINGVEDVLADRILLMEKQISNKVFDFNDVLDEVIEIDKKWVAAYGFDKSFLKITTPETPIWIRGNKISMGSLAANIIANARKYAKDHKEKDAKVDINVEINGDDIIITVKDNGKGIPPEKLKDIWNPLLSEGNTRIGLKESKLIAEDHGGSIDVQSTVGKGTTFEIRLPLYKKIAKNPLSDFTKNIERAMSNGSVMLDPDYTTEQLFGTPSQNLKGKDVLVLGCGGGIGCFRAILDGANSAVGVDLDENSIKTAKLLAPFIHDPALKKHLMAERPHFGPGESLGDLLDVLGKIEYSKKDHGDIKIIDPQDMDFIARSATDLSPLKDNSFDIVTMGYLLTTPDGILDPSDITKTLMEAMRVVRPDGRISIFPYFTNEHSNAGLNMMDAMFFGGNMSGGGSVVALTSSVKIFSETGCKGKKLVPIKGRRGLFKVETISPETEKDHIEEITQSGIVKMEKIQSKEEELGGSTAEDKDRDKEQHKDIKFPDAFDETVIVFPDLRDTYPGMGRELYEKYPSARRIYNKAAKTLKYDDVSMLFFEKTGWENFEVRCASLVTYAVAMFKVFSEKRDYPVKPLAVLGSSVGGIATAIVSGAISMKDGLRVIQKQAQILSKRVTEYGHTIVKVDGITSADIEPFLMPGEVEMMCDNLPTYAYLIVDDGADIGLLGKKLLEAGAKKIEYPILRRAEATAHISYYKKYIHEQREVMQSVKIKDPEIPIISSGTGKKLTTKEEVTEEIREQLYNPILWRQAIKIARDMGAELFLPIGAYFNQLGETTEEAAPDVPVIRVNNYSDVEGMTDIRMEKEFRKQVKTKDGQASVNELLWRVKHSEAKTIIGIDTSWIPEGQMGMIPGMIEDLKDLFRERGLEEKIEIVRGNGKGLAGEILAAVGENDSFSNVIVLGDHKVLDTEAFDPLRSDEDPKNWAFFAGVEALVELEDTSYIRLIEMLRKAVNIAFTGEIPQSTPYLLIKQEGVRIFKFIIPEAEVFDHDLLKEIYENQIRTRKSA